MRGAALAILILELCGFCPAQKVHFSPAEKGEILQLTKNVPQTDQERGRQLEAWFKAAGCGGDFLSEQKVPNSDAPNISCRMGGKSADAIVVGAHYDRPSSTQRPIDNWTGALLLPALYKCLSTRRRRHTVIFVAFADSGNNLSGAQAFIDQLSPTELGHVKAMINLDALGLSSTKVWSDHSDKELVHELITMVYTLKIPASQVDIAAAGSTDSEPFLARNIPQITIHSMTQANLTSKEATAFRADAFYDSYRLICGYIAFLDESEKLRPHS